MHRLKQSLVMAANSMALATRFNHIQPGGVFRGIMEDEAVGQPKGFCGGETTVERTGMMGVERGSPRGFPPPSEYSLRIALIGQMLTEVGKVPGPARGTFPGDAATGQGLKGSQVLLFYGPFFWPKGR